MSLEPDFLDMMPHRVTIRPWLREGFHGEDILGDPKEYQCRIVGKGIALRRREGEEDTVIYDVYLNSGNDAFTVRDQITLPADIVWSDQTPLIFAIGRYPDEHGHHHTKIQCGFMYHRQGQ